MSDLGSAFSKSFSGLMNNPIVVVPTILLSFLSLLIVVFFSIQLFIGALLVQDYGLSAVTMAFFVFFFLLDIVLILMVSAYYSALEFGVITDVVSGKKCSFGRMFRHGKGLFLRIFSFNVVSSVILQSPVIILAVVYFILSLRTFSYDLSETISPDFLLDFLTEYTLSPAVSLVNILTFVLTVFFSFVTLFAIPIMIGRKISGFTAGFRAIVESFRYTLANFGDVFITALIAVALWIASFFVILLVSLFFLLIAFLFSLILPFAEIVVIVIFLLSFMVFMVLLSIFTRFFIFNSYFQKNKLDWT